MLDSLRKATLAALDFALRRPQRVLLATGGLLVLSLIGAAQLKSLLKIQDVLDRRSEQSAAMRDLSAKFSVGNTTTLLLAPPQGQARFSTSDYCTIVKWYSGVLFSRPDTLRALSTFDLRRTELRDHQLLYPEYLQIACDESDSEQKIAEAFRELRESPYAGIFVSPKFDDILIGVDFENRPANSKFGTFDPAEIIETRRSFAAEVAAKIHGIRAYWMGEADFQHSMLEGIQQIGLLNLAMLLLLMLALRAFFGTWKAGLLFVVTLFVTALFTYGMMGWFGAPLDVLTNSLFMMLAVSALEDFIFVAHDRLHHESEPWRASFRKLALPGFLTSLTTVFGFFSLCTAREQVIPRFGFWAGIGATMEYAAMFWVLPALLARVPSLSAFTHRKSVWLRIPELYQMRIGRRVAFVALAVFPLAIYSAFHLTIFDSPIHLFPAGHPIRKATAYAQVSRGWEASLDVIFRSYDSEKLNRGVIESLSHLPGVAAIQSPYAILDFAQKGHPLAIQEQIARDFKSTSAFRRMVAEDGTAKASLFVASADLVTVNLIRHETEKLCPNHECFATGSIVAYADFTERIPTTLLLSFLTSLALVLGLILWLAWERRVPSLLALSASVLWGPSAILTLMAFAHVRVNLMTCMFASALVGLTGDNAIQFILGSSRSDLAGGISARGGASLLCSGLMAMASLLFLFSYFDPPHAFGILLACGLIAAVFGDIWLLRAWGASRGTRRAVP